MNIFKFCGIYGLCLVFIKSLGIDLICFVKFKIIINNFWLLYFFVYKVCFLNYYLCLLEKIIIYVLERKE